MCMCARLCVCVCVVECRFYIRLLLLPFPFFLACGICFYPTTARFLWKKKKKREIRSRALSHQFFGNALFLCSDQFRRCNFKCKYRMQPHTAYGYRDRLRIGNNSNISRNNISPGSYRENCKCFHRANKIGLSFSRARARARTQHIFILRVH